MILIYNTQSTGDQKKIDEIVATVNVVNQILYAVMGTIIGQIATETNFSPESLKDVMLLDWFDLADYPISCIAEALFTLYHFINSTYDTIEDAAVAAKASLEASP
ncbi:CLUMA_CG007041, isoform A [Clunio marinus]|uniref:CLUMA_CG007041, isoform A n=1 Tax=Clunio marinus TaxID=568069 RepID=A0A1J1I551_9DIPT|nr:CLUMA_CG007041, isoform A [Clunio marinus]